MYTRAPPIDEQGYIPDKPRSYQDLTEPFMVTIRQLGGDSVKDIKMIWWYIAALDEGVVDGCGSSVEEEFSSKFFPLSEAKMMLSFQNDLAVLEKAIKLQRQKPAERSDVGTETFLPAKGSGMLLNLAHVNGERAADPSGISVFYSAMNA
ncbi:hypothetical protein N7472_009223 [Penicillium cf. griseofulvum]|uniref:Uncharacterized protein n=1 Tax=Penicillium cf. griseofulvum TaxID=2972120 RepID=A0A9W9IUA0_9EURO|nr:hypothetical protein N7472_009223 [Penicillium cf. griseofulvum]